MITGNWGIDILLLFMFGFSIGYILPDLVIMAVRYLNRRRND